jgi:ornithine cyclodeaminase
VIDGDALTVRRTAAVSALAARYLAREDAHTLVMVGSGHLAPWMVRAHCALRPSIRRVLLWSRRPDRAEALALTLASEGLPVDAVTDLESSVRSAQLISCATTSHGPIVQGAWLTPGAHLDLVGGFTRDMREADDAAIARCRIAVDTYDGVLSEAGDIVVPLENGSITRDHIVADLAQLVRGDVTVRTSADQITLFKSVGTALADLAAATAVIARPTR